MDPFASQNTGTKKQQPSQNSSFANALAELERPLGTPAPANNQSATNDLLSQAMARTGSQLPQSSDLWGGGQDDLRGMQDYFSDGMSSADSMNSSAFAEQDPMELQREQMRKLEEEQAQRLKKERHKKLHEQINPVDTHDIFSAKEERVKRELEETRREIKQLAKEVEKLHRDIDIAASQTIVSPGDDGSYYVSFLQKLRGFIMLLRQKVKSASSWANTAKSKQSKKKKGAKPGLEMGGNKHEQTKTVFDMMHHEQSNNYSGS